MSILSRLLVFGRGRGRNRSTLEKKTVRRSNLWAHCRVLVMREYFCVRIPQYFKTKLICVPFVVKDKLV